MERLPWDISLKENVISGLITLGTRSEDQENKLVLESFYDHNLTPYLINKRNQIIQGSRGTGKTHILRVLEQTLGKRLDSEIFCIFLDCRQIGSAESTGLNTIHDSSSQFDSPTRFFQYFLEKLYQKLIGFYDYQYFANDSQLSTKVRELLSSMKSSIITISEYKKDGTITIGGSNNSARSTSKSGNFSIFKSFDIGKSSSRERARNASIENAWNTYTHHSATFPQFGSILQDLLTITNKKMFLLLDEWSSIPKEIQPYFADFLRRTLFPISRVKLKIAAVPYRNSFCITKEGRKIGLEINHDIEVGIDLDQTYSLDESPEDIVKFCYYFLCKHLSATLRVGIEASDFIKNMFDNDKSSFLLVRAAEGNPRDFIRLTFLCVQNLFSQIDAVITQQKIFSMSEMLFASKLNDCTPVIRELLDDLVHYVVDRNKNRGFLIDRSLFDKWSAIKYLLDIGVIHILKENYRGYSTISSKSCVLLVLHFGTYCDALQAGKPINFFWGQDVLERNIFPPKRHEPSSGLIQYGEKLLYYDQRRKFYLCYLDLIENKTFFPYFISDIQN